MQKFPFVILYIVGKSIIKIIAVFHTSRNPEIVGKRFVSVNENYEITKNKNKKRTKF